jgi:hypothetical protein
MNWKAIARRFGLVLCLPAPLLLTGCFETTQEYTLNPDGSGKVVHESTFQRLNLSPGGDQADPAEALRDAIRDVLKDAKGVDAWRDVTFKKLDDGRMYFRGTAYFKDLSKLEIPNQTMLDFVWATDARGSKVLSLRTNTASTRNGLTVKSEKAAGGKLSPEDRAKQTKEQRAQYQQAKPMLATVLGSMKHETVFHLPGQLTENSNFELQPSGALRIKFEGAKLVAALDKLAGDESWWQKDHSLDELNGGGPLPDEMNELVFGKKGPVRAVVGGAAAPLFNYAAEVAAARTQFAKTEKELGLTAAALAPPARGEALKNLRVVGVRLITESDTKRELRPFNFDAGYTLSLAGEFSGSVLAIADKSAVETATDTEGNSLLPASQWDRSLHFSRLSKDKTGVIFEVALKLPEKGVTGLKELSGHLQYQVANGTRQVDLGLPALKEGAKGSELGAEVKALKEGWRKDGSQEIQVKLNIRPEEIKSAWLGADANKIALDQSGYFGGNNSYTFTFSSKQSIAPNARLVLELFDHVETFETPFRIQNITLLGNSAS